MWDEPPGNSFMICSLTAGNGRGFISAQFAGGGMRGGKQARIFEAGNTYVDAAFPNLDKLIRATVL